MYTNPKITAASLYNKVSGSKGMPNKLANHSKEKLKNPLVRRTAISAYVRIRRLTQNGNTTIIKRTSFQLLGALAIPMATGKPMRKQIEVVKAAIPILLKKTERYTGSKARI